MKICEIGLYAALVVTLLFAVTACGYVNKKLGLKDDNVIEETGEAVLKDKIGVDIDFTPDSLEDAKK